MKVKEEVQEVVVNRSINDVMVEVDKQNHTHITLTSEVTKQELVKQLVGFYNLHGIRTMRRSELHEICSKAHGLLKTDGRWHIHTFEKPVDDLVEEGVLERIQYTEPKKATYLRLTNKFVNDNLK
jgi:hypothetical protein